MAFSVITVSTWNKWQHCLLRMEHRRSLLKQVASVLSKHVQCFQWSSRCQCQDLIFSFQESKCYQDPLYLSTLAKGLPSPLDLWPLFSYLWAAQSHTRQLLPVQWAWFTPFLSPTWETEEELKNWTFPDTLHYSLLFTIYFLADVCCVTRKLIQWLLPCAPHMDK